MAGTPGSSGGVNPNAALTAVGYAAEGYQVGIGPSYGQSTPFDYYVLANANTTTVSPLSSLLLITSPGTITGNFTIQLPSNAADGFQLRIISKQTMSGTLTIAAGTNALNPGTSQTDILDSAVSAITALTANTPVVFIYRVGQATSAVGMPVVSTNLWTWYRIQ